MRHPEATAQVAAAVNDEIEQAGLVDAQRRPLGLGGQERAGRGRGRHVSPSSGSKRTVSPRAIRNGCSRQGS